MRYLRFFLCTTAVALTVACNALVGNDPPTLRTGVVADQDASTPNSGPPACPAEEKKCFGTCVPKFNSGFSCASETSCDPCPQYAHATPLCNGPVCGAECKKGYENCDTTSPDCETDLASAKTCGACNGDCQGQYCSPDGAGSFHCTETCGGALVGCETNGNKQCVDLQESSNHCGACNKVCPEPAHSTATCNAAQCGFVCDPGFHACNGQCVGIADVNACGDSCQPCGKPPPNMEMVCDRGSCDARCLPGWEDCDRKRDNGCEVDLMNDNANCGGCLNQCGGGITTQSNYSPPVGLPDPYTCCMGGACQPCKIY